MAYNKSKLFYYMKPDDFYNRYDIKRIERLESSGDILTLYDKLILYTMKKNGFLAVELNGKYKPYPIESTNTKAPIARIADKVSGIFVPTIIIIAVLTFVAHLLLGNGINTALVSFVTLLVVACPCALGLATPLAIIVGEGICAKNGILVKKSETLEKAHKVDTIVFDKTGTLTYGTLKIAKLYNYSKLKEDTIIDIIASLERNSVHPIANAFKDKKSSFKVQKYKNIDGIGLFGIINNRKYYIGSNKLFTKLNLKNNYSNDEKKLQEDGCSIIYLIEDENVLALVGIKDIVRTNAKEVIKKLGEMNKEIIMLTGDNETTANIIARKIGIKKVIANVLPKEKANIIKDLIKREKKVMMVGDGVNDAPSLSIADIGVSLTSATDIAGNSAEVILMQDNLKGIYNLLDISRKTLKNIKQNLFWAFFYNICMIPIAMGLLRTINIEMNPMIAGIAMTLSSLTVILNALRLKRWKEK